MPSVVDGTNASMPTDPSLGTISTSVQVPELALVAQQVGCLLMLIHCLHLCRVEAFLFSALDVVLSTIQAVHGNNTIHGSVVLSPQWPPALHVDTSG